MPRYVWLTFNGENQTYTQLVLVNQITTVMTLAARYGYRLTAYHYDVPLYLWNEDPIAARILEAV